jgi:hypothetical protein
VLRIALHAHIYIQCCLVCYGGLESCLHRKVKAVVGCSVDPQLFIKAAVNKTHLFLERSKNYKLGYVEFSNIASEYISMCEITRV